LLQKGQLSQQKNQPQTTVFWTINLHVRRRRRRFSSQSSFLKKKKFRKLRFLCPLLKRQPRSLTKFQDWVQPKLRNFVSYPNWYRTLTLGKESSPNRVQQPISIAEDVANTELHKRSVKETPLIRPSTSRANGNDNWIFNKICLVVHILFILFFDYLNCGLILKKSLIYWNRLINHYTFLNC
jgi:hypothetical protein